MKITVPVIAAAAILTLALAGCSGGGGTSTSGTATTAPKTNGSSSSKDYSADDLVALLTKAEATLKVKGTIKDDAQLKADLAKLGKDESGGIATSIAKEGGKITPASCATALNNLVPDAKNFTSSGGVEASLTYSKGILGVLANPKGALPTSISSGILTNLDGIYSSCGNMKLTLSGISGGLSITKVAATTNADQTYAFNETIDIAGQKSVTTSVQGIYGNLYISEVGLGGTLADDEAAINAVVAAAK